MTTAVKNLLLKELKLANLVLPVVMGSLCLLMLIPTYPLYVGVHVVSGPRMVDGDLLGVAAQDLLGELHHDVQAAGLLEGGGAADHRQDGEDDRHRWTAGLEPEGEDEDEEPDPGNQTEGHAATVGTDDEAGEDNDETTDRKSVV